MRKNNYPLAAVAIPLIVLFFTLGVKSMLPVLFLYIIVLPVVLILKMFNVKLEDGLILGLFSSLVIFPFLVYLISKISNFRFGVALSLLIFYITLTALFYSRKKTLRHN